MKNGFMKNLIAAAAFMIIGIAANAQKPEIICGSMDSVSSISRMRLVIDYSEVKIRGINEKDFLSYLLDGKSEDARQNWIDYWNGRAKDAFFATFRQAFIEGQKGTDRIYLTTDGDEPAAASMTVRILTIDDRNNITAEITIENSSGDDCVTLSGKGRGVRVGTFQYGVRMAFKSLGHELGEFVSI